MAFNPRGLSGPYYFGADLLPGRLWVYTGAEVCTAAGYFTNAPAYGLEPGDIVLGRIANSVSAPTTITGQTLYEIKDVDATTKAATAQALGGTVTLPPAGMYSRDAALGEQAAPSGEAAAESGSTTNPPAGTPQQSPSPAA